MVRYPNVLYILFILAWDMRSLFIAVVALVVFASCVDPVPVDPDPNGELVDPPVDPVPVDPPEESPDREGVVLRLFETDMLEDDSGLDNHATAHNSPSFVRDCVVGGCFAFDPSRSTYLLVDDDESIDGLSEFSFTVWVRSDGWDTSWQQVFGKGNDAGYLLRRDSNTDRLALHIRNDDMDSPRLTSTTNLALGRWYHVAGVYSSSQDRAELYIDGVLESSDSTVGAIGQNDEPLVIGARYRQAEGADRYWRGMIDALTLYDTALTAEEVRLIYEEQAPSEPTPPTDPPVVPDPPEEPPIAQPPDPVPPIPEDVAIDVPLNPSDLRIVVVAQDGSGQYRNIQDALNAAQPGDTIRVKNGKYVEALRIRRDGTRDHPIALMAYPGHSPVISPGDDEYPFDSSRMVRLDASWIIIDGFEFRYGRDGIRVNEGHNTIRNNWIHHNQYIGILNANYGVNDLLIENNIIESNGVEECWHRGEFSPRHCHQIYFSKGQECDVPMADVVVRGNTIRHSPGAGIQWNAHQCSAGFERFVVENNRFVDTARAFTLYHNVRDTTFQDNEVVITGHPDTNAVPKAIIMLWGSTAGNVFEGNEFSSTVGDVLAIDVPGSGRDNRFDHNVWDIASDRWRWDGTRRSDFRQSFRSITGWEENGEVR